MIKIIAFDVFGTIFDLSSVNKQEIKDYANHIHKEIWEPLRLPKSWETLPAHPDSKEGVDMLKKEFIVVTCSNGNLGLLTKLSKHNNISWDAIIPLELNKVYKPNPKAYLTICEVLNVEPNEVMMVTANKNFGDLEASEKLGMLPVLIRHGNNLNTVIDLANQYCSCYKKS